MIFEGQEPVRDAKSFVAEGAKVIGKVTLLEYSSIWFNAVARGDVNRIQVGRYSNVQDNSVLHVADDCPTIIGDFVSIGHNCVVHGATIEDNCLLGIGSVILNKAVIGKGSIIAAGAVVKEGQVIPPHSLVAGVPGKIIRQIPEEWDKIHARAVKYKTLWTVRYGLLPDADGESYQGQPIE